jgi:hypothetical protein
MSYLHRSRNHVLFYLHVAIRDTETLRSTMRRMLPRTTLSRYAISFPTALLWPRHSCQLSSLAASIGTVVGSKCNSHMPTWISGQLAT